MKLNFVSGCFHLYSTLIEFFVICIYFWVAQKYRQNFCFCFFLNSFECFEATGQYSLHIWWLIFLLFPTALPFPCSDSLFGSMVFFSIFLITNGRWMVGWISPSIIPPSVWPTKKISVKPKKRQWFHHKGENWRSTVG